MFSMQPEMNASRPTRARQLLFPLLAVAIVSVVAWIWFRQASGEELVEHLKQEVRGEIPIGTPSDEVRQWAARKWNQTIRVKKVMPKEKTRAKTIHELAGIDPASRDSLLEVVIPAGQFEVRGEVGPNHLWVFFTLDEEGKVSGHYFLTLEELAEIEKRRREQAW